MHRSDYNSDAEFEAALEAEQARLVEALAPQLLELGLANTKAFLADLQLLREIERAATHDPHDWQRYVHSLAAETLRRKLGLSPTEPLPAPAQT